VAQGKDDLTVLGARADTVIHYAEDTIQHGSSTDDASAGAFRIVSSCFELSRVVSSCFELYRVVSSCFELYRVVSSCFELYRVPTHALSHALQSCSSRSTRS
jgi:hypothetical protein